MGEQRQQLETMPEYFAAWDTYCSSPRYCGPACGGAGGAGALHLPTRREAPLQEAPGHRLSVRPTRATCPRGVELHRLEAACGLELRSVLKLVLSYNHHKAANEHQSPVLRELQIAPPEKTLSVLSDWKELISLPISHCASGEQFYATATGQVSQSLTYYLVISDILDHTCLRTNHLDGRRSC